MAQQNPSKNKNISEVVYNVTLKGLASFREFRTDEFFVNGTGWHMRFAKENIGGENYLGVDLHSNFKHNSNDTHIVANFDVMLVPSDQHVRPIHSNIELDAFSLDNSIWGIDPTDFILWNDLLDKKKGFIDGNRCSFQVRVKATPLLNAAENEWLSFNTIGGRENDSCRKFRLKMKKFQTSIGVCSPKIKFDRLFWRIVVFQKEGKLWFLICKTGGNTRNIKCEIKLLSSDLNGNPITIEEDAEFVDGACSTSWDLLSWDDLINPEKQLIRNDNSFVIEVELKAEQSKSAPKKRRAAVKQSKPASKKRRTGTEDSGAGSVLCAMCFEDLSGQPISSVKPCNHLFCTDCVRRARRCPMCNGVVQSLLSYIATE